MPVRTCLNDLFLDKLMTIMCMINAVVYPTIMHMNDNYVHDQGSSLSYNYAHDKGTSIV